ncbi:Nucleolar GTP-binding protein 1 [Echinococcus granulosus]|nr:Nucleolar GTP-binding protein 1 [Echinococcus granulosus]
MSGYNFKSITVVPSSKEFIDIVLSKTQRKTPTVIHKQYPMPRIRNFYMRKVKTCQQFFHDKLNAIVTEFPMVESIHPFYADLINVLYSKDHYKLALGQINTAKNIIDGIARDQVKMLKYGESLYQCKTLKRTALGRMCTVIKRQANNLKFLEDTRQHLSRLPSINPDTRTLIVCGFPNVGKSSFINKITRADVDVQPFPFTTKSLFLGHTDYKNLRWQVIDTPGVLDRPLDEHNTIEMVAITALAHLQAAVIYLMDLSEQCGYSVEQQVSLFKSLSPLFSNKPLLVVANKSDVKNLASLSDEDRELVTAMCRLPGEEETGQEKPLFMEMSTLLGDGVMEVRARACDDLLTRRVEAKLRAGAASLREGSIANRLYIARPKGILADRPPNIPETVLEKRRLKRAAEETTAMEIDGDASAQPPTAKRPMTMRDRELAEGDDFYLNLRDHWLLKNPHERNDIIPEIVDGHNIADFFDPDIEARLNELEEQEKAMEEAGVYDEEEDPDDADPDMQKLRITAKKIREARALRILESQARKNKEKGRISRAEKGVSAKQMKKELGKLGLPVDVSREVEQSRERRQAAAKRRAASLSVARSEAAHAAAVERSSKPRARSGVRDDAAYAAAVRRARVDVARRVGAKSRKGEADRHIPNLRPKHLFSGKRSIGKTQRR